MLSVGDLIVFDRSKLRGSRGHNEQFLYGVIAAVDYFFCYYTVATLDGMYTIASENTKLVISRFGMLMNDDTSPAR
jgi:hypothetical protein